MIFSILCKDHLKKPMKKINLIVFLLIVSGFTVMTGCKKKKKDPEPEKTFVKPNDQQGSAEADEAIANANDLINNKIGDGANQRRSAYNLPCGVVSVDSSTTSGGNKVYKMNYGNQTPCGYKYKSGEVSFVLTNGTAFNQAGSLSRILKNLEENELIRKVQDEQDKRLVRVFLTEKGKEYREIAKKVVKKFNQTVKDNISEHKMKTFFEVMEKINNIIAERNIYK
jgi:vacuolar-type H+-ATPase subunit H